MFGYTFTYKIVNNRCAKQRKNLYEVKSKLSLARVELVTVRELINISSIHRGYGERVRGVKEG
jgi:hypothetical protein